MLRSCDLEWAEGRLVGHPCNIVFLLAMKLGILSVSLISYSQWELECELFQPEANCEVSHVNSLASANNEVHI